MLRRGSTVRSRVYSDPEKIGKSVLPAISVYSNRTKRSMSSPAKHSSVEGAVPKSLPRLDGQMGGCASKLPSELPKKVHAPENSSSSQRSQRAKKAEIQANRSPGNTSEVSASPSSTSQASDSSNVSDHSGSRHGRAKRRKSAPPPSRPKWIQDDVNSAESEMLIASEHLNLGPKEREDLLAKGLPAELPAGWVACRADEGEVYYHCAATSISQWAHPVRKVAKFEAVGTALRKGKLEEPPIQHSVYDARSRHVDLPTPSSLLSDEVRSTVIREDLLPRTFALHGLLSETEAGAYVESAAAHGFHASDVAREFPTDVRNNSRLIHFSDVLAAALWKRLAPHLMHRDIFLIQPMGYAAEGRWKPVGVNPCFRIGQYQEGEHFAAHCDGMYVNDDGESSIYSIVLYLNDDFDGGELELPKETIFRPQTGTALLFPHDTLHTARAPTRGIKYVARSELMFRCVDVRPVPSVPNFVCDPLFQRMAALYAQIGDLAAAGDAAKTTAAYQEALGLQIAHKGTADSVAIDSKLPVHGKLLARALSFMTASDVLATATVSSSWHAVTAAGLIWRAFCQQRWPNCQDVVDDMLNQFDPELKDWLGLYKHLHSMGKSSARICTVLVSDKLEFGSNDGGELFSMPAWAYHRESGHPWDSSMKLRRGWDIGTTWRECPLWLKDKVVDWDMLPELYKHAYHCLQADPSANRLLVPVLPGVLSKSERARLLRILKGRFQIPKVYMAPAPLCALLAHNLTTGTVVWGCSMGRSIVSCYIDAEEVAVVGSFNFHSSGPDEVAALLKQAAADLGEGSSQRALEHVVFSMHGPPKLQKRAAWWRNTEEPEEEEEKIPPPPWTSTDQVKKLLPFSTEVHAHSEGDVVAGGAVLAAMPDLLATFECDPEVSSDGDNCWEWRLLAAGKWHKLPTYCVGVLETALRNGSKTCHIQMDNFLYLEADLEQFTCGVSDDHYGRRFRREATLAPQRCRLTRFLRGHPSSSPDTQIPDAVDSEAQDKMELAVAEEVSESDALHVRTMAGRVVFSMAKCDVPQIGPTVQQLQEEIADRCSILSKQVTLIHGGQTLESSQELQPVLESTLGAVDLLLVVGKKPKESKRIMDEMMLEECPGEPTDLKQLSSCIPWR